MVTRKRFGRFAYLKSAQCRFESDWGTDRPAQSQIFLESGQSFAPIAVQLGEAVAVGHRERDFHPPSDEALIIDIGRDLTEHSVEFLVSAH